MLVRWVAVILSVSSRQRLCRVVRRRIEFAHRVKGILSANVPMETLSSEQWDTFYNATQCHVCENRSRRMIHRVRDHCHLTGRYRGPAHSNCNLNYKDSYHIPVVFHNLSGYDAYFIIKEITIAFEGRVKLLPLMKEKYILFTKKCSKHRG